MNEIIEKLKSAFEKSEMSYFDLAKKTGISKSSLQRYFTGETKKPPFDNLLLICSALDVSAADVLGWNPSSEENAAAQSIADMVMKLSPENQDFLARQAALLLFQQETER